MVNDNHAKIKTGNKLDWKGGSTEEIVDVSDSIVIVQRDDGPHDYDRWTIEQAREEGTLTVVP